MAAELPIVKVVITATSPLSFSQRKPGGIFQESLGYVPGGALRGVVAAALLDGAHDMGPGHPSDCAFCRRFLDETAAAVFTNAYPIALTEHVAGGQLLLQAQEISRVLPLTSVSCKTQPGFLPRTPGEAGDDPNKKPHGVFDTLLDRYCCATLRPAGLTYDPICPGPKCGGRVDRFSGFYVLHDHDGRPHGHKRSVQQHLLTRVAIDRRRGVAEEGQLYSPWVMSEAVRPDDHGAGHTTTHGEHESPEWQPSTFVGRVAGADDAIVDALRRVATIGGSSSQGLNQVRIDVEQDQAEKPPAIKARVIEFDRALQTVWQAYHCLGSDEPSEPRGVHFALTLQSDAIFCDADGRPRMAPEPGDLGLQSKVELVYSDAASYYAGGWNSAWGLPKPAETRVHMGSVYLFQASNGLVDADYDSLASCQIRGIGLHRSEGLGQVRVCDEFHLMRREGIR